MLSAVLDEEPVDSALEKFDEVAAIGRAIERPKLIWYGLMNAVEERQQQGTEPPGSPHLAEMAALNDAVADREMSVWFRLHTLAQSMAEGDAMAAREHARRAVDEARAYGGPLPYCVALALAAEAALDQGDSEARAYMLTARELARSLEHGWAHAQVSRVEGRVREQDGDLDGALAATQAVLGVHIARHRACCRADARVSRALLLLMRDGPERGIEELCLALDQAQDAGALSALAIGAAHLQAIGTQLGRRDLAGRGREQLERARARVVDRRVLGLVAMLRGEPAAPSYLTRRAGRVLAAVRRARDVSLPRIAVAADGSWVEVDGKRASLARRAAMRRILCALVERRTQCPGAALSHDDVCRAGWPGERMRLDSARARVYNAIRLLRRLGLDEHIVTTDAGYVLAGDTAVEVASRPARALKPERSTPP